MFKDQNASSNFKDKACGDTNKMMERWCRCEMDYLHVYVLSMERFKKIPRKHRVLLNKIRHLEATIPVDWVMEHILKTCKTNWAKKRKVVQRRFGLASEDPPSIYSHGLYMLCKFYARGNSKSREAAVVEEYLGVKSMVALAWGLDMAKRYHSTTDNLNWCKSEVDDVKKNVERLKRKLVIADSEFNEAYDKVDEGKQQMEAMRVEMLEDMARINAQNQLYNRHRTCMLREFLLGEGYVLDESDKTGIRAFIKDLATRWSLGLPYYGEMSHSGEEIDRFSYYNPQKSVRDESRAFILDYIERTIDKLPVVKIVKIVNPK